MEIKFSLNDIDQTADQVLAVLNKPTCILCYGEMGAGKTTFIQALCRKIGVKGNMGSPTFSIINEYATSSGETVYHLDLYRLKNEREAVDAGVEDCFYSGNYCFVEWPERTPNLFDPHWPSLEFRNLNDDTRTLIIKSYI